MSNSSVCGRNRAEFTFFIFTTNVYEIMSAVLRSPISVRFESTFLCAKKVSFFARSLRNIRKALHKYLQEWHCWSTSINGAESFAAFLLLPRHVVHVNASCGLKNKSIKRIMQQSHVFAFVFINLWLVGRWFDLDSNQKTQLVAVVRGSPRVASRFSWHWLFV